MTSKLGENFYTAIKLYISEKAGEKERCTAMSIDDVSKADKRKKPDNKQANNGKCIKVHQRVDHVPAMDDPVVAC
jgi:hypothetical protein